MKLIIVLTFLCAAALAQVPHKLNVKNLKDIWESPRLQTARTNIESRLSKTVGRNRNSTERVVGGSIAAEGQFPFHVFTVIDDQWICGGSLINADWVLTVRKSLF